MAQHLVVVDPTMLSTLIREALADEARPNREESVPNIPHDGTTEIMTRAMVLSTLQISESTLTTWQKKGILTPRRIGSSRRVYFLREDLDRLLRDQPHFTRRSR